MMEEMRSEARKLAREKRVAAFGAGVRVEGGGSKEESTGMGDKVDMMMRRIARMTAGVVAVGEDMDRVGGG